MSYCQGLVTLTLDRVILHTVTHHSSTSIYIPNYIEIEESACGRTNVWTDVWMDGRTFETHFIRSTQRSRPNYARKFCKNIQVYVQCFGSSLKQLCHIKRHTCCTLCHKKRHCFGLL